MSRRGSVLGLVAWLALAGVGDAGGRAGHEGEPAVRRRDEWRRSRDASERAESIRRAREEIRKNPEEKKFILFRYGLREEDLR